MAGTEQLSSTARHPANAGVPLVQQRATGAPWRYSHADGGGANVCPLQPTVSCPKDVAILVSSGITC